MDRQTIFDTVGRHLLTQQTKALEIMVSPVKISCVYRMEHDGKTFKCAIGALIPDELYTTRMEGRGIEPLLLKDFEDDIEITELGRKLKELWGVETIDDIDFLVRLQLIHDAVTVENWRAELAEFAEANGLNTLAITPVITPMAKELVDA